MLENTNERFQKQSTWISHLLFSDSLISVCDKNPYTCYYFNDNIKKKKFIYKSIINALNFY